MELFGFLGLAATIVGTGIALAGLMLRQGTQRDARLDRLEIRLDRIDEGLSETRERVAKLDRLEPRLDRIEEGLAETRERVAKLDRLEPRLDRIDEGFSHVRERMAKLEGLLEGLREAISGRRPPAASDPA